MKFKGCCIDQDVQEDTVETHLENVDHDFHSKTAVGFDNEVEHQLSLWYVLKNHKALVWWAFFFAVSAIGWGFDSQVNTNVISVPAFRKQFGHIYNGKSTVPAEWLSAFSMISSVGQFFGAFLCSLVIDKIGRRLGLAVGIVISCGGIFGEIFATTRVAFLISKFFVGISLGFYLTIGPLYSSEVSPVVLRGITTAGINLGIVSGQLLSNAAVKGFSSREDSWAYRGPFAIQFFFIVFLALGLPFAVESPWYLVHRNDIDGARTALQRLYGNHAEIETKLTAIRETMVYEMSLTEATWTECFRGSDLVRTGIACGAFLAQHCTGIIFILGYSTYFFELAGLPTSKSFDLGVGVTACGVVGTMLSWTLVNSFGRRRIFLTGMFGLTISLLMIGILDVIPSSAANWAQASFTIIYNLIYQSTIGVIAFVLLGEVSSLRLRAKTTALATATQSALGIAMNVAVPYMVDPDAANMKGKVGFVFGGLSVIATSVAFFYIPELKGRTFAEIDVMFANCISPRKMGMYMIELEGCSEHAMKL